MLKYRWIPVLLALLTLGSACPKKTDDPASTPGAGPSASAAAVEVDLEGIDSASMTPRERRLWSAHVSELIAPCPDVALPLDKCVKTKASCASCLPAAKYLVSQVRAGRTKEEVVTLYEARFHPDKVKTIHIGGSASYGPKDASVTVVEFADFECPACGLMHPVLKKLKEKYAKQVRFVFKHFPLDAHHPHAKLAAQAAYAAQKQGAFWKMHDLLFQKQQALTEPDLMAYAKNLGFDLVSFKRDMHGKAAFEWVDREKSQGVGLGVQGTPTVYINGRDVDWTKMSSPLSGIDEWIALELQLSAKSGANVTGAPPASGAAATVPVAGSASAPPATSAQPAKATP